MWLDLLIRALVGGTVVSGFALLSDVLKPKSFAGLFGAAPSVALATLALTVHSHGHAYAANEARSMIAGSIALAAYGLVVARWLVRSRLPVPLVASAALVAWFAVAFALRAVFFG